MSKTTSEVRHVSANMKTAVIYTGQARTFRQVYRNQYWHVLRKLENPTFYVSVAEDEQAEDMQLLRDLFPSREVHIEYVEQLDIPEPVDDPPFHNIYPPSSSKQAILRQLWAMQQGWRFGINHRLNACDMVVRIRPDLAFGRFELPKFPFRGLYSPYWARWGGVNDRVGVMNYATAIDYFNTYDGLQQLWDEGCPLHPEQMIAAWLELCGCKINHTLATEFITVRLDGSFVPMSISEVDKLEYVRVRP